MSALETILERKDRAIYALGPHATVLEAVTKMCDVHVGALLVIEGDALVGIVSERDVLVRVLLERLDPTTTLVESIMSTELVSIEIDAEVGDAMDLMTKRRVRHLPVLRGGALVGVLSMGDLVHWVTQHQDFEIRALTEYVSGVYTNVG